MKAKYLLYASVLITVIVVVQELFWLGRSNLAWVILILAISVGLQSVYLLMKK